MALGTPTLSAGASFQLGDSSNVLTELAQDLLSVTPAGDAGTFDATTFNPGATLPTKVRGYEAPERTYTLVGWWNQALDDFFEGISGMTGRNYQYGPQGTGTGKRKTTGTVNVGPWSGNSEQAADGGFMPFSIELAVVTRTVSVF